MRAFCGLWVLSACLLCLASRSALAQQLPREDPDAIVMDSVSLIGPAPYRPNRLVGLKELSAYVDGLRACVPRLVLVLMTDTDPTVRAAAAGALGKIGPHAKDVVPQLVLALKDEQEQVRAQAAGALGWIGLYAKEGVPPLIHALKDKSVLVRRSAAQALGRLGPFARPAVPALLETLADPDPGSPPHKLLFPTSVRQHALTSLGDLGPDAKEALPALLRFYQTDKEPDGGLALVAAVKIARHKSLIGLCLLGLKDEKVCEGAALALAALGPDAKEAVPHLVQGLKDPPGRTPYLRGEFQGCVMAALARIGPDAKEAIPTIRELMKLGPDSRVGSMASTTLTILEKK